MKPRSRLWTRLVLSHLAVVAVGSATVFVTVGFVAPSAFDAAMGHAMPGMDVMMSGPIRSAFQDAVQTALVAAIVLAAVAALVVSAALSARLSRPIAELAAASRRIAAGHYAERVRAEGDDEIGELAGSFNTMAASLESTERRRLQLVGDVAHELRTPLTTLDGYLEGLEDAVVEPTQATWELLRTETARLSTLVDDLQDLWRAEARQLPLRSESIDAAQAVEAVRGRFAGPAAERGATVGLAPVGPGLRVMADPGRLSQILDNFVSNAIRYSPDGGSITVGARGHDGAVTFLVTDEGAGLTAEQAEQVFERFYRVDPSRSRALGGSGIGLAITRALAEAMGGSVAAASAGPGRGSTFSVTLPAA